LTQITGNPLLEGLAKFREMGLEFSNADRVEALSTIRDLLNSIVNELKGSDVDS
jgi:hypothetical protein